MNFALLIVGRVFFGIGSESLGVCQSAVIAYWFKGKELSFALGLSLSFARLGSVINGWIVPAIFASTESFGTSFLFGLFVLLLSFLSGIGVICMENYSVK